MRQRKNGVVDDPQFSIKLQLAMHLNESEYDKNQLYAICFSCGKENVENSIAISTIIWSLFFCTPCLILSEVLAICCCIRWIVEIYKYLFKLELSKAGIQDFWLENYSPKFWRKFTGSIWIDKWQLFTRRWKTSHKIWNAITRLPGICLRTAYPNNVPVKFKQKKVLKNSRNTIYIAKHWTQKASNTERKHRTKSEFLFHQTTTCKTTRLCRECG
jgi:hypothetical protein